MDARLSAIATAVTTTRCVDEYEQRLLDSDFPVAHSFSARGHELAQAMVAANITDPADGVFGYYRSKCVWFSIGMTLDEYVSSALQKTASYAGGRNLSVLPYRIRSEGATLAPTFGGVGSQFEPALGWARSLTLPAADKQNGMAFVFAGDGAVSTGGFWSAVRESTAANLPLVIVIENNGVALSTRSSQQFPGGSVARLFQSFPGLTSRSLDGSAPENMEEIRLAIAAARETRQPLLLELIVPRLSGHSSAHKVPGAGDNLPDAVDPVPNLEAFVVRSSEGGQQTWADLQYKITAEVDACFQRHAGGQDLIASTPPDVSKVQIPIRPFRLQHPFGKNKVSVGHAINAWLRNAMAHQDEIILLGEDIGAMGGVHGVTAGLQAQFGAHRVVDSSLNESSILGQAMGLALNGCRPIAEIQYRKYLDCAVEQFHNIGWCHWLTNGGVELPVIIRVPFGCTSHNDPWHSESEEATILRALGYRVFCPSNAQDAIDSFDMAFAIGAPTVILEHRGLYYDANSRNVLAAPSQQLPLLRTKTLRSGDEVTIVSWGNAVRVCNTVAAELQGVSCEVIDLNCLRPWDYDSVANSIRKTGRCLIVHEDRRFLGLGAEISATVSEELFRFLKHPVIRLGAAENPVPINPLMVPDTIPSASLIAESIKRMLAQS